MPPAPRTTQADGTAQVARAVQSRTTRPAAWWGMLLLIASEGTLFGAFVGTYYYLRFRAPVWPPPGVPEPELWIPIAMALVLALTSIPMALAWSAARAGRVARTRLLIVLALVVQAGYIAYQLVDFDSQLDRADISENAYTSIYYVLLGADHAHVLLGMLFSLWLLWKLVRGLTTYRANATQAIAWYWHFVNVVTILVTAVLLSARA
jgi:heme/copper-type cytochrome/quinol oxidase subunit 3